MPSTWLVTKRQSERFEVKGVIKVTIVCKLIYHEWEEKNGCRKTLRKETHHTLTGPMAEATLIDFATQLNAKKNVPPLAVKCRMDGWRQPK